MKMVRGPLLELKLLLVSVLSLCPGSPVQIDSASSFRESSDPSFSITLSTYTNQFIRSTFFRQGPFTCVAGRWVASMFYTVI